VDGVCSIYRTLASLLKETSFAVLICWRPRLLICVENMLCDQCRGTIVEALDIDDLLFADPDWLAGCGIFGNQMRRPLFNVEHSDLRSLGVGIERVCRDLGSDVVLVGFSPVHPMQASFSLGSILKRPFRLSTTKEKKVFLFKCSNPHLPCIRQARPSH
jgi:hypothetical protein